MDGSSDARRRRLRRERLAVDAPDPRVGAAIEWANHRLDAYLTDACGGGSVRRAGGAGHTSGAGVRRPQTTDLLVAALGSLAGGGFDAARAVIRAPDGPVEPAAGCPGASATGGPAFADAGQHALPLYLLLAAWHLAWTGDLVFLRSEWQRVRRAATARLATPAGRAALVTGAAAQSGSGGGAAPEADAARDAALGELVLAAEVVGDAALAAELRRHAPRVPVRLDGRAPGEAGHPHRAGSVEWTDFAAGRTEAAVRGWWPAVERAARQASGDPAGPEPARGRDAGGSPEPARTAAAVLLPFVHGLLGAEPDAARGRLRLRPQIPAAWDRLLVTRLRVGDAAVTLRYHREAECHTFRLEQLSGGIPVTAIFEPALAGRGPITARVDGQPAQLDPRPFGERLLVPVQLVLDHERTLEIHVRNDDPDRTP